MNELTRNERERWEELKASQLLFGLSAEEQAEYEALARRVPAEEAEELDRVVAALDLAWANAEAEPLPAHLARKVLEQSRQELRPRPAPTGDSRSANPRSASRAPNIFPWLIAAALLGFAAWVSFNRGTFQQADPELAQLRETLIATAPDLLQAEWAAGPTPIAGAGGDIVWSTKLQQGFMRFRGIPANTPTQEQFQLWIFDKNQSEATPIDGGVFDISGTEEVIVPIDAKLEVKEPFLFAVTIEKPGGVVVSSRERLPLLAAVE